MGHTRRYSERMNLAVMTPSTNIASTGYWLAAAGKEYLIYLPDGGSVTVDLSGAEDNVAVEWFDPDAEQRSDAAIAGGAPRELKSPFKGAAVLYLHRQRQ
jgi:hypothetical protein